MRKYVSPLQGCGLSHAVSPWACELRWRPSSFRNRYSVVEPTPNMRQFPGLVLVLSAVSWKGRCRNFVSILDCTRSWIKLRSNWAKAPEEMKVQLAVDRRDVDGLLQGYLVNPAVLQAVHLKDEILEASAQVIPAPEYLVTVGLGVIQGAAYPCGHPKPYPRKSTRRYRSAWARRETGYKGDTQATASRTYPKSKGIGFQAQPWVIRGFPADSAQTLVAQKLPDPSRYTLVSGSGADLPAGSAIHWLFLSPIGCPGHWNPRGAPF